MDDVVVIGGEISLINVIDGDVDIDICLDGECGTFIAYPEERESYDGDYMVVPKTISQMLATANKLMLDNVVVKEIPYFETSNESGITVYIANTL